MVVGFTACPRAGKAALSRGESAARRMGVPPANKRHTKAQASCVATGQSSYTGCWFTVPASGGASWAFSVWPGCKMPSETR